MKKIHSFVIIGIIAVLISILPFVLGTVLSGTIVSPANNAWTNDATPDFTFRAISNQSAVFPCYLYIDGLQNAGPEATTNNTDTIITASFALSAGAHQWYINCSDVDPTPSVSEAYTINIDNIPPVITLDTPVNNHETKSQAVDFKFGVTDNFDTSLVCSLYIDNSKEGDTETVTSGESETIEVSGISTGNHTWYVNCTDDAGNVGQSDERNLTITAVNYCECGDKGTNLILKIEDPDIDDEFYPGENITIKIKVENQIDDDLDVVVEAELYDLDDQDSITDIEHETVVKEDYTKTITLKLKIPFNVNQNNDYVLNIKAYEDGNEEEQCREKAVEIKIKKKSHSILIDRLSLEPETAECGSAFDLDLKIANIGRNDEDVKLKIYSSDLLLNEEEIFSLDEGDSYSDLYAFFVPSNITEGSYLITTEISYHYYDDAYHSSLKKTVTLNVKGNCPEPPASDVSFTATQSGDSFIGKDSTTRIAITNSGNIKTTYTINASGYELWSDLVRIEPSTITLDANEIGYAYVIVRPSENVTGIQTFTVKVNFDSTTKEQVISIDVKKTTEPSNLIEQFVFEVRRNWMWTALIGLLVIIVVILAVILGKQSGRKKYMPAGAGLKSAGLMPTEINLKSVSGKPKPAKAKRKKK